MTVILWEKSFTLNDARATSCDLEGCLCRVQLAKSLCEYQKTLPTKWNTHGPLHMRKLGGLLPREPVVSLLLSLDWKRRLCLKSLNFIRAFRVSGETGAHISSLDA